MRILDRVRQLRPVSFRYIEDIDPKQEPRAGFIAQEVQEIFPEAVVEENGVLLIDLRVLIRLVTEAVEEYEQQKL